MKEIFQEIQYEEKSLKAAELAKKAAEAIHITHIAKKKSQKAMDAINTCDKEGMWHVLQEYLREYAKFINDTAHFSGLCLRKVDQDFYNNVTSEDIKKQLHLVIGLVYACEAVNSAARASFKDCLKKLLKNSGLFTDAELVLL